MASQKHNLNQYHTVITYQLAFDNVGHIYR